MIQLKKLEILNFGRIKHLMLDDFTTGICLVKGENQDAENSSNGAGKTTLFEAICWGLFGRVTRGSKAEVSLEKVLCQVTIFLDIDGEEIRIVRNRGGVAGSGLAIFKGDRFLVGFEHNENSYTKGQERLNDYLGMTHETFLRANYFSQYGMVPFGLLPDKALKSFFIEDLLGLQWLDACYQYVNDKIKGNLLHLEDNKRNLETYDGQIKVLQVEADDCLAKSEEFEIEKKEKVDKLYSEVQNLQLLARGTNSKKVVEEQTQYNLIKQRVKEASSELLKVNTSLETSLNFIVRMEREIEGQTQELADKELLFNVLNNQQPKLVYVGSPCPFCGQLITKSELEKVICSHQEKLEALEGKINIKKISMNEKIKHLEDSERKVVEQRLDKEKLEELLDGWNEELEFLPRGKEREGIFVRLSEIMVLQMNEQLRQNPHQPYYLNKKKRLEDINQVIVRLNTDIEKLEKEMEFLNFWSMGFSPKGIQSFILDNVIPPINERVQRYLSALSGNSLWAEFVTTKLLKSSDETRETFHLSAWSDTGADNYRALSGGERARVNIATMLAIGDFKRSQGKSLDLIILDEVFIGLDQDGRVAVLKLIRNEYPNSAVFVVSHEDLPDKYFDREVTLRKQGGIISFINLDK